MSDMNPVYWRIYQSQRENDQSVSGLVAVCMQWFDEYDYDQSKFYTHDHFDTEEDAQAFIDQVDMKLMRLMLKLMANR